MKEPTIPPITVPANGMPDPIDAPIFAPIHAQPQPLTCFVNSFVSGFTELVYIDCFVAVANSCIVMMMATGYNMFFATIPVLY